MIIIRGIAFLFSTVKGTFSSHLLEFFLFLYGAASSALDFKNTLFNLKEHPMTDSSDRPGTDQQLSPEAASGATSSV